MSDSVTAFSDKIDQLIAYCQKLEMDNKSLRSSQDNWLKERATLLQKNDLARTKIEAMISRLRALEQS